MIDSQPLVSVIMNCYNGEKYLHKAIESVLSQTYNNWEVIFWDNQSTDASAKIFNSYNDKRLRYFFAPAHDTLYGARNFAIEKSSGKFLAFLDVDDFWIPIKLECQIPLFSDEEVGLVYSNFFWKNELKNSEYIAHKRELPSGFILGSLLKNYSVGLLTVIVRRSAFMKLQLAFNPSYNIIGDFDMAIRLSIHWKFGVVQFPTAYCRWHGNNLQITEVDRQINELHEWSELILKNQYISNRPEFYKLKNNIKRMKSVNEAQKGNYLYSIKTLLIIYGLKNKVKIIAAIVLPKKIFTIITSR